MVTLGSKVKDSITGFEGVAVGRAEYLYGCVRIQVEPCQLQEGKRVEPEWFDEQRLESVSTAKSGGPCADPPGWRDP